MSAEDLDNYETDAELSLYKEYRDVYFDVRLTDAWVWDVYRSSRFVKNVRIVTFKDVNVEEVQKTDIDIPDSM